MLIKIRKSGNSASFRIPADVLRELDLNIGDDMIMKTTKNMISFEKKPIPRDGWFDNIDPIAARNDADEMETDFQYLNDFEDLDRGEEKDE